MVIVKEKEILKQDKIRRRRLNVATLCANFFLGLIWCSLLVSTLVVDPIILVLKQYTKVRNGSLVHELLQREMEGIHIRAFLFNATNAHEFAAGRAPALRLQEVGPFTYREWRRNVDIEIDEERERMRYTPAIRMEFLREESVARPEDVNVTMPNIPMLGTASNMAEYPYLSRLGFNLLATQLDSQPLVSLDASNYLWGYSEPLVSLSHRLMPGSVPFDKMGILDRIYDASKEMRVEVSTADEDKYMVRSLNGHSRLAMGDEPDPDSCELCDKFEHTYEGVGYRPGIGPDFPIKLFRIGICRMFDMQFHGTKRTAHGADALVYHFKDSFFTLDPNGTASDVTPLPKCFMGMPLAFSKPHLMGVDPGLQDRIQGLDPNPERFQAWIAVDPKIGVQLETMISLQINLVIGDVSYNSQAKNFANMVLPICFVQIEQPPLPDESKMFLSGVYGTGPWLLLAAQLCFLVLLLISWGYVTKALYQYFMLKDDTIMSFPTSPDIKEINANIIEDPLVKEMQPLQQR